MVMAERSSRLIQRYYIVKRINYMRVMNSKKNHRKATLIKHHEAGFTLLEMAVIVVVSGIVLAFLGSALLAFLRENEIKTTESRLVQIEEAITRFLSDNGRYPCPASRFEGSEALEFGREVTPTTCNIGNHLGTTRRTNATGSIRIGAVPNRSLNLSDDLAVDGWGRKFTYVVTGDLATPQNYQADAGEINVDNISVGPNLTDVHYVVISHGPTGAGGFSAGPSNTRYIPCPTLNTRDRENCDDDDFTFRKGLINPEHQTTNFYDDYIIAKGLEFDFGTGIPTGAVLPFQTTLCPDGWTRYRRAEGHYSVGAITTDTITGQPGVQNIRQFIQFAIAESITAPLNRSMNMNQNAQGEQRDAIMPAYVAMTYCEKLPS